MKKEQYISDLLIRLNQSEYGAFSDIFMMYHRQVYLFCHKSLGKEDAEEITQNVFMLIWENRHKIDPQYSFSSYLFSIAKHQIYNIIRNRVIQKSFVEKYLQNTEQAEMPQEYDNSTQELKIKMREAINQFPNRQREIFMMSRVYKMTYKEIAGKLGISENTVDTTIRRSLNVLRTILQQIILLAIWLK